MKRIAKIAIPAIILASLVGCSSSQESNESTPTQIPVIGCPFTEEQLKLDAEDQAEIASFREAVATGEATEKMKAEGITIDIAHMMIDLYDGSMKNCK